MYWACIPTAEEDHNWVPWIIVGHEDELMISRFAPGPGSKLARIEFRLPDGSSRTFDGALEGHSILWREDYDRRHPGLEYLEESDFEDFCEYLRKQGYTAHLGQLEWAAGVLQ